MEDLHRSPVSACLGTKTFEYYHPMFPLRIIVELGDRWRPSSGFPRRYKDRLLQGDLFLIYLILLPPRKIFYLNSYGWKLHLLVESISINCFMAVVAIIAAGVLIWRTPQAKMETKIESTAEIIDIETEDTELEESQD